MSFHLIAVRHLLAVLTLVVLLVPNAKVATAAPDICDLFPWWPGCQSTTVMSLGR